MRTHRIMHLHTTHRRLAHGRNPGTTVYTQNMGGDGIMDYLKSIYNKGKNLVGKATDFYSSDLGTSIRNSLPDSDDTARPGFAGEKHAILKLPNGKYGVGNWIGPGTQVIKRLERGDPPRTLADKVAMRHDIDFTIASGVRDKVRKGEMVRTADRRMVNSLKRIQREGGDANQNIQIGMRIIQGKMLAEDAGLMDRSKFAGNTELSENDKAVLEKNKKKLEQEGFGILPGDRLKLKLLKRLAKEKPGKGINLSGRGPGDIMKQLLGPGPLTNFIVNAGIPSILKALKVPPSTLNPAVVQKVVQSAISSAKTGDISSIVNNLSKAILPLVTGAKLKQQGKGRKKMSGKGIMDAVSKVKDTLLYPLNKGLFELIKMYAKSMVKNAEEYEINRHRGKGKKGRGFWQDFARDFSSVFKPFATIAGPILDAVGLPEFGIPLSAVGAAL